jgi:uncharacterized protein (DUF362 family)
MTRRELLALGAVGATALKAAPTAPVSIVKCPSYQEDILVHMEKLFDQLGGLGRLVKNKTVTIKVNLTGSPGLRFQGKPLGVSHYTHPKTIGAMAHLLGRAGARRIRFVESAWGTGGPLEEYLLDSGWNVRQLLSAAPNVEFENTNALGKSKQYKRFKVPGAGHIYPGFDLNQAYYDTDFFISMAKLKNHATCGVTLAMKNIFGTLPASIYGDDAGVDEPNEKPTKGRMLVCHAGSRQPAKSAPGEIDATSERNQFYRMPRIVADINAARPIDLALIDGIETMAGGEGPWIRNKLFMVQPGLLIAGTNAVTSDTVATACMGYDPRAVKGKAPFTACDNTLLLAEQHGLGTTDLKNIEVAGVPIAQALFRYPGA